MPQLRVVPRVAVVGEKEDVCSVEVADRIVVEVARTGDAAAVGSADVPVADTVVVDVVRTVEVELRRALLLVGAGSCTAVAGRSGVQAHAAERTVDTAEAVRCTEYLTHIHHVS